MTSDQLTAVLAKRVMGWRVTPERFLKGGRRWSPRWHFQPLRRIENARQLLEKADGSYTFSKGPDGTFTAHVSVRGRDGMASGRSEAATIAVALARAIGIDVHDQMLEACKG